MTHPNLKLGRLPGTRPVGLRDLTWYAAGALPKAPAKVAPPTPLAAWSTDGYPWGMDGNDNYGDCGVAGVNHGFMADAVAAFQTKETFPTDDEIVDYYLTYTGGEDNGVVLSDFLSYVKQKGFLNSHTIKAYAPVHYQDITTLHFAIWAYCFAYTGIEVTDLMQEAYQEGQPWTLESFQDGQVEGGHCVPLVGYDSKYLYCVTWGKIQPIEYSAWNYMASEAWAVVTGEFLARGGDGRGVKLDALEADINKLNK